MSTPVQIKTVVKPGHKVEVEVPELAIGAPVEVSVAAVTEQNGSLLQARQRPTEQWIADWRAWIASHPDVPALADDSRESIYEGRGE